MARLKDVVDIFGEVSMQACLHMTSYSYICERVTFIHESYHRTMSMQACLTDQSSARSCYRLVGRSSEIEHWPTKDPKLPLLDHHRAYYPEELYPSEKVCPVYTTSI